MQEQRDKEEFKNDSGVCYNDSVPLNVKGHISSVQQALFMGQCITNYHCAESEENQLNTPSLRNNMGLFIDNNTHLHLLCAQSPTNTHTYTHTHISSLSVCFVLGTEDNTCLFPVNGLFNSWLKPI